MSAALPHYSPPPCWPPSWRWCLGALAAVLALASAAAQALAGASASSAASGASAGQAGQMEPERHYNIPAGPLAQALTHFARSAGVTLSFTPERVQGRTSAGVSGRYTVASALAALLAGSGLQARADRGGYTLEPAAEPPATATTAGQAGLAHALPEVRVRASVAPGTPFEPADSSAGASVAKLDTPLEHIPRSIQIVSRELLAQQNPASLPQALRNVSGVNEGSGTTYGFFDRFLMRGLEGNFLRDGLPDGPAINGYARTLLGIDHIEVLKGPGSALFGNGNPGGSINLVRRAAAPELQAHVGATAGSFGRRVAEGALSGPLGSLDSSASGEPALRYRIDALSSRQDGFRGLHADLGEVMGAIEWRGTAHLGAVTLEHRRHDILADTYGIPFRGTDLLQVPADTRYYTAFGSVEQVVTRLAVADRWRLSDTVQIQQRLAYLARDVTILRNAGGSVSTTTTAMTGRQLRRQVDDAADFTYQFEPLFRFATGPLQHTLLTGLEVQRRKLQAQRETASLPSIANVFAPTIAETSLSSLSFTRNFSRGLDLRTAAVYLTDQIRVQEHLHLRASARVDRFDSQGNDASLGRSSRRDTKASWDAGAAYELLPGVLPFVGASRSHLVPLSSETANVDRAPEQGAQTEVGIKFKHPAWGLEATLAAYRTQRSNFLQTVGTEVLAVGEQRTHGEEVDVDWRPLPWLHLVGNLSRQQARLTRLPQSPADQGKRPAGVPRGLATLWLNVEQPVSWGRIGGGVGARKQGALYADNANTRVVPGATTIDAALTWRGPSARLRLDARNVFDRAHYRYALFGGAFPGEPRSLSLSGQFDF